MPQAHAYCEGHRWICSAPGHWYCETLPIKVTSSKRLSNGHPSKKWVILQKVAKLPSLGDPTIPMSIAYASTCRNAMKLGTMASVLPRDWQIRFTYLGTNKTIDSIYTVRGEGGG